KIETVMPNRLKIALDFGNRKILRKDSNTPVALSAKWLFGADVQNLDARVETVITPIKTAFDDYKSYTFDDPTRGFTSESQVLFDGTLNQQGNAAFPADITGTNGAP